MLFHTTRRGAVYVSAGEGAGANRSGIGCLRPTPKPWILHGQLRDADPDSDTSTGGVWAPQPLLAARRFQPAGCMRARPSKSGAGGRKRRLTEVALAWLGAIAQTGNSNVSACVGNVSITTRLHPCPTARSPPPPAWCNVLRAVILICWLMLLALAVSLSSCPMHSARALSPGRPPRQSPSRGLYVDQLSSAAHAPYGLKALHSRRACLECEHLVTRDNSCTLYPPTRPWLR